MKHKNGEIYVRTSLQESYLGFAPQTLEIVYVGENGENTINVDTYRPSNKKDLLEIYYFLSYGGDEQPNCMILGSFYQKEVTAYDVYENYINREERDEITDEEYQVIKDKIKNIVGERSIKFLEISEIYGGDIYTSAEAAYKRINP